MNHLKWKLNRVPIESFIMQTVFETETTLQHPYEFINENALQYPHESKSKARVRDRIPDIFDIWCESKSKARVI